MASVRSPRAAGGVAPALEAPALRSLIASRYQCVVEELTVAETRFSLLRVADTNALLEALDPATFLEDERLPYWSEIWASSVSLAQWCLSSAQLRGKRVLELGCGVGLAGIAAARAGATVILSDHEEDALLFAQYNALQNLASAEAETLHVDWRRPPSLGRFDVMLGADILYERRHFLPLLEVFDFLLAPEGKVVLTDPGRSTGESFGALAQEWGYRVSRDCTETEYHGKNMSIIRFELQPSPDRLRGEIRRR